MKNKNYTCYKVLLIPFCCGKQIEVASMNYHNAIKKRNQLIETFGKKRVTILKKVRPMIKNKQSQIFYEIG